jgi:hypothetical protein
LIFKTGGCHFSVCRLGLRISTLRFWELPFALFRLQRDAQPHSLSGDLRDLLIGGLAAAFKDKFNIVLPAEVILKKFF